VVRQRPRGAGLIAVLVGLALVAAFVTWRGQQPGEGPTAQRPPQPEASAQQAPRADDVLVIAHRGASAYAPHDTVAAAREALSRGADAVEVDIRQTRDGRLVALFRASLAPTTNVEEVFPERAPWRVESFTLAELRQLDAGSWFGPEFAGERVPTLVELVAALEGSDVALILEAKTPQRYPGIGDRLRRAIRRAPGRIREVESFDLAFLRGWGREHGPVRLGAARGVPGEGLAEAAAYLDAVNPPLRLVDRAYVERAHDLGLEVKVWSVNTPPAVRRALGLGVDGIYSHRPDMVRDVVEGGG
jgi:glycerophosphoryl diester phosphodiesterase